MLAAPDAGPSAAPGRARAPRQPPRGPARPSGPRKPDPDKKVARLVARSERLRKGSKWAFNVEAYYMGHLTPLQLAAGMGCTEAIRALVAAGASLETEDNDQLSPLHHAAVEGQAKAIRALVNAGADIEVDAGDGLTPLHIQPVFMGMSCRSRHY